MERQVARQDRETSVETVDASIPERGRVSRIVVVSTIGGFAIAGVASVLAVGFVGLVLAGVITGVSVAAIAGSDYPRRRVAASILGSAMIAAVALGLWLGGLAVGLDPAGPDAGQGAMISLIAAVVPVVLGSLLGYMIGRERRRGRTA